MKKLFTTIAYKRRQRLKNLRKRKRVKKGKMKPGNKVFNQVKGLNQFPVNSYKKYKPKKSRDFTITAPMDFRLLHNTVGCLKFFSQIRDLESVIKSRKHQYISISLKNIVDIDYSTISILTAIADDLRLNNVKLRGDFPLDMDCKDFFIESGFLNKMSDQFGNPFPQTKQTEMLIFEKGTHRFTLADNKRVSLIIKNVMKHLTGQDGYCQSIRTILLEIFANSIEWSETKNKQWLLGVKYENEKVIFTVTDVGKGILKTLYRKHGQKFRDYFSGYKDDKILLGAFEKKYSSQSQKINRNKGLPSIKARFDEGKIKELKVLTNNVILHFDKPEKSFEINQGIPWFKGTFYRWIVTKECLLN